MERMNLLKAYFKEMDYSKAVVDALLETNPFGEDYVAWERRKGFDVKFFSNMVKKNKLVRSTDKLYEICQSERFAVASSFFNEREYCLVDPSVSLSAFARRDSKIIIQGIYRGEDWYLKKLKILKIPFIAGYSTNDKEYYDKNKGKFFALAREYDMEIYEDEKVVNEYMTQKSLILCNKAS